MIDSAVDSAAYAFRYRRSAAAGCVLFWCLAGSVAASADELASLVEAVAKSDDEAAARVLLDRLVAPFEAALQGIEARPSEEQRRLLTTLDRVYGAMRMRLFRAGLSLEDRMVFDRWASAEPGLVADLFDEDDRIRLRALEQIPAEPDGGAGLLIVAKLADWNAEVRDAAIDQAARLAGDAFVLRGAAELVRATLDELKSGRAIRQGPDMAIVHADFLARSAAILARADDAGHAPIIAESLAVLSRQPYRRFLSDPFALIDGLGRHGDERSIAPLLDLLADTQPRSLPDLPSGAKVTRTVGDAALLALARIYRIDPASMGFVAADPGVGPMGFLSPEDRLRAHAAFRAWHERNAAKSMEDRALFSLPAPTEDRRP